MADIRVSEANWIKLKIKPLFFVQSALPVFNKYHFNVSQLVEVAKEEFRDKPAGEKLGRGSIENIVYPRPVTHKTARRFIRVLNRAVRERGGEEALRYEEIIAAVFRIKSAKEIFQRLDVSNADLAARAGLSETLIDNVRRDGRVHFAAAIIIRSVLQEIAHDRGLDDADPMGERIFGDVRQLLSDDKAGPIVIHRDDYGECMIRESDLELAPVKGHAWALE